MTNQMSHPYFDITLETHCSFIMKLKCRNEIQRIYILLRETFVSLKICEIELLLINSIL